jgi:hypothetical protein
MTHSEFVNFIWFRNSFWCWKIYFWSICWLVILLVLLLCLEETGKHFSSFVQIVWWIFSMLLIAVLTPLWFWGMMCCVLLPGNARFQIKWLELGNWIVADLAMVGPVSALTPNMMSGVKGGRRDFFGICSVLVEVSPIGRTVFLIRDSLLTLFIYIWLIQICTHQEF